MALERKDLKLDLTITVAQDFDQDGLRFIKGDKCVVKSIPSSTSTSFTVTWIQGPTTGSWSLRVSLLPYFSSPKSAMSSNVLDKIRNLDVKEPSLTYRKHGIQDENGKWTEEGINAFIALLMDEDADTVILPKLKKLEEADSAKKKTK